MRYRIGYDATWINKFAPAFPTPTLRKLREERGTRFVGAVKETKGRATRPSVSSTPYLLDLYTYNHLESRSVVPTLRTLRRVDKPASTTRCRKGISTQPSRREYQTQLRWDRPRSRIDKTIFGQPQDCGLLFGTL